MHTSPTPLIKAYYHPLEAAIRWSNLHPFESTIYEQLNGRLRLDHTDFPRWPKLILNYERLLFALLNGELMYGKQGIVYDDPRLLQDPQLSIGEVHLKAWMSMHYPEEKPRFLFTTNELGRLTRLATQQLLNDNSAMAINLNERTKRCVQLKEENVALMQRVKGLEQQVQSFDVPSERSVLTFQHIIGGMLTLLRGTSPGGQRYSVFDSDSAIIEVMLSFHPGRLGITQRTLQKHFAAARRSLDS
ncbi:hypothetical protein SAMN04490182_2015 [Pseudomonas cedrina]|nr:hypothetical protein [Pseudomonas cedrina]SDS63733.1 hypothetical protein SAMN04490182_2015 [Pseudomonas cedrina]